MILKLRILIKNNNFILVNMQEITDIFTQCIEEDINIVPASSSSKRKNKYEFTFAEKRKLAGVIKQKEITMLWQNSGKID